MGTREEGNGDGGYGGQKGTGEGQGGRLVQDLFSNVTRHEFGEAG